MARIRTIKPEFWRNAELAQLSEFTRLVAVAVLNLADDEGYFEADARLVRGDVFPFEESSVRTHGALTALCKVGYLQIVSTKNKGELGYVCNFAKHQVINRPTASKLAKLFMEASTKHSENTGKVEEKELSSDDSLSTHGVLTDEAVLEEEQGTGNRKRKRNREEEEEKEHTLPIKKQSERVCVEDVILSEWNRLMQQDCRLTAKRKTSLAARINDGYWWANWKSAVVKASESDFCRGLGPTGWIADFEWFVQPDSVTKLLEGKYENRIVNSDAVNGRPKPQTNQEKLRAILKEQLGT